MFRSAGIRSISALASLLRFVVNYVFRLRDVYNAVFHYENSNGKCPRHARLGFPIVDSKVYSMTLPGEEDLGDEIRAPGPKNPNLRKNYRLLSVGLGMRKYLFAPLIGTACKPLYVVVEEVGELAICVHTVHIISFKPRVPKSVLGAPSSRNFGFSFLNHSPHYIPNFRSIGSYAALCHDLLSAYVEYLCHNLKWRKISSTVS